jgi:hypothetical protein
VEVLTNSRKTNLSNSAWELNELCPSPPPPPEHRRFDPPRPPGDDKTDEGEKVVLTSLDRRESTRVGVSKEMMLGTFWRMKNRALKIERL